MEYYPKKSTRKTEKFIKYELMDSNGDIMEILTESGVRISVIKEVDDMKSLIFDRPIKGIIGLTKEESMKVGALLIRDTRNGLTADLRNLIDENFFLEGKKFSEIRSKLESTGAKVKSGSLSVILRKMVERGELIREGEKGSYRYSNSSL